MATETLPDYIPINNNLNLSRHIDSYGIINTDKQSRTRYILQREKILTEKKLLSDAIVEIGNLRSDLNQLKEIVLSYTAKFK
jgi:hypothetical protein